MSFWKILSAEIVSLTLTFATALVLSLVISPAAYAQFGTLNAQAATPSATPTPTLTTLPLTGGATSTPTPTRTPTATTPAAGNALPTFVFLISSLILLSLGIFTWKIKLSSRSA